MTVLRPKMGGGGQIRHCQRCVPPGNAQGKENPLFCPFQLLEVAQQPFAGGPTMPAAKR